MTTLAARILTLDTQNPVALSERGRRFPLAIIGCTKSKLPGVQRVREIYTGECFKLAVIAAEVLAERWVVISGKHGVLHPEDIIESYDESVMTKSRRQREQWRQHVSSQLKLCLPALQGSQVLSFVSAPCQQFVDLTGCASTTSATSRSAPRAAPPPPTPVTTVSLGFSPGRGLNEAASQQR